MFTLLRTATRLLSSLLLVAAVGAPLHAQLDPRLQGSTTDFLDLYQQANVSVKPEIVTVFDFSGSMQSLMYHPNYYNQYLDDNGDPTGITFQLVGTPGHFSVSATVGPTSWGFTSTQLIRPDGSLVTEANIDANMVSSTPHLYGDINDNGGSNWACDVRNWVRSASHIRMVSGGRTIDLPIPWKVMSSSSTGYPLSSMTIQDYYSGPDAHGNPVTYGSGQWIDVDTRYKIQTFPTGTPTQTIANNMVLSGPANQVVTRTTYMLRLSQFYLNWLFTGTYQNTDNTRPDYNAALNGQYIVFDAASTTPNGIQVGLQTRVNQGQGFGTFVLPAESALQALALPGRDRVQAVKEAAIRTWIAYQTQVFWAFRFLDDVGEAGNDGHGNATATSINNSSTSVINTTDATSTWVNGNDTGWTLFNGNSVAAMNRLAALFPYTNTPLAYATARALAQFTDPNNVFGTVETGADAPVACQQHFLLIFTDGVPTVDNNSQNLATTPYITNAVTGSGTAQAGNAALIANPTNINPGNTWWNIFTYSGIAAHLADTTKATYTLDTPITTTMALPTAYPTSSASPSSFLPFAIPQRLTTTITGSYRQVTTMTIGVSLGGLLTNTASPKYRLFLAAAVGDPKRTSWTLSNLTNYTLIDPNNPASGKTANSTYFFDATNPTLLTQSLQSAFKEATGISLTGATSNPNLPFIGASAAQELYIGQFLPPVGGDVLWSGDLLMFPTKLNSASVTVIMDKNGNPTTNLSAATAGWSAAACIPLWSSRNLYTRIPGATTLSSFKSTGTAYTDSTTGLKNFVAQDNPTAYPINSTAQQGLINMVAGAEPTNNAINRTDIMGDIIDSTPAYLEYATDSLPVSVKPAAGYHYRIILVGTNQGWLHAFGETSIINSVPDPTSTTTPKAQLSLASGTVQELWAFMPSDFLHNLDYLNIPTNSHKFMVDGSPSIYFLDLPASTGGSGNGLLDGADISITPATDTTHERAIAIIGLRKGGRSYYALNLHDPTAPTLQWSLVPDEASQITADRNETGMSLAALQTIVGNMGYSTCTPSFGRITFNGVYRDAVFLGGGLSLPEIEANFTGKPLLGRSVLALDVNNGHFLGVVDLTQSSIGGHSVGPIPAGVVPFEFFLGSGMAQRAYFLDMWGGLWSWGSKNTVAGSPFTTYSNFRMDTSEFTQWSSDGTAQTPYAGTGVRKVYQDAGSSVTAITTTTPTTYAFSGPIYSTAPAPFLVGSFPGQGFTSSSGTTAIPAAVGIAMESGNRNNPLDYGSNNPSNNRLTLVFDRQDSRAWGLDTANGPDLGINTNAQLLNAGKWGANGAVSTTLAFGAPAITPGGSSYYLTATPQFGYYVTFPDPATDSSGAVHYSKGITAPSVVANTLYYSYFTPTMTDVCTGGSGYTYTNKICDVMNPVVSDVRTGLLCTSGWVDTWFNVASELVMLGTPGVQQAGTRSIANPSDPNNPTNSVSTNTYLGTAQSLYPRTLVWRTVH